MMRYEIHTNTKDKELFERELKAIAEKYEGIAIEIDLLTGLSYDFSLPKTLPDHRHIIELPKHEHISFGQRVL